MSYGPVQVLFGVLVIKGNTLAAFWTPLGWPKLVFDVGRKLQRREAGAQLLRVRRIRIGGLQVHGAVGFVFDEWRQSTI